MSLVLDLAAALVLAGLATLAAVVTAPDGAGGAVGGTAALASASSGLVLLPLLHLATVTPLLVRTDLVERRLPNSATVSGVVVATAASFGLLGDHDRGQEAVLALVAQAIVLGVGTLAAQAGVVGMGDVKLAALLAGALVLVQPRSIVTAAVVASLVGGAAGIRSMLRRSGPSGSLPFGPAMLVGSWSAVTELASRAVW